MNQAKVRGGALVAGALASRQVSVVFTLSGGFINPIIEGLMIHGIKVLNAPHEQVAGHLADGWARITRSVGVCLVGPEGFANAVPAMLEAYGQRSPVLFITGSSTLKRRNQGGFKEVDHVRVAEGLTKYSVLVTDGKRIPDFINKAIDIALSGNPGPVHVSIPTDLLYSSYELGAVEGERPFHRDLMSAPPISWPAPAQIEELARRLRRSRRPLLVVGNGVWWGRAEDALADLVNRCGIPTLVVPYHQAPLGSESRAFCGLADVHQFPPAEFAFSQADLVLTIGCRLDNMLNFGNPPLIPENADLVCINESADGVADNQGADFNVLGHPKPVLSELANALAVDGWTADREWLSAIQAQRKEWIAGLKALLAEESRSRPVHPLAVSTALIDSLGRNDYLVIDGGDTHYWAEMALNMAEFEGRRVAGVFHPGPYSLLGCGVAFGIAIKMANPGHRVVVLSGDGAFLCGGLSIEAAFHEQCPITVVIDNNRGLGSIEQQQRRVWESGGSCGTAFRDIPFDGLFNGLGGHGETIDDPALLPKALENALAADVPSCINVRSRSVISPLVAALTDRRAKASIE